jgi:hypothetical protein
VTLAFQVEVSIMRTGRHLCSSPLLLALSRAVIPVLALVNGPLKHVATVRNQAPTSVAFWLGFDHRPRLNSLQECCTRASGP